MAKRKQLNRDSGQRRALLRSLATSVLANERIKTTHAKAKAAKPVIEKLIELGKRGGLHARRQALSYILDEDVATKLFEVIGPRYKERPGGYTRILKIGPRRGDGAPMALLELV
jgi:large subunit ribosomal protein L17